MQHTYFCPNCKSKIAFGTKLCVDCGTPFNTTVDGIAQCVLCGCTNNVETYEYDIENGVEFSPEHVLVRLSLEVKEWLYEMSVKIYKDLLTMEVEIKNRRFNFIYNLNNISANITYLKIIVDSWKTYKFTNGDSMFIYKGVPGCLLTETDWKMISETLNTLEQETNRMRFLVEKFITIKTKDIKGEPSWKNMEYEIDNMLYSCREMYNFFKYGACVPEK